MRKTDTKLNTFIIIIGVLFMLNISCKRDPVKTAEEKVEDAQDAFIASLVANPPTKADISDRVKVYLLNNTSDFFGATVTLLDSLKIATYSPYWYRSGTNLMMTDLNADTAYNINNQSWLRQPIDGGTAIWTAPYFDAGGGNIWMKTRAVPVIVNGKTIAVATTDLAL